MKLENQVCSLELAKRLQELGVKQESLFYWSYNFVGNKVKLLKPAHGLKGYPHLYFQAYTVAELGAMLPHLIEHNSYRLEFYKFQESYGCDYVHVQDGLAFCFADNISENEADARAKMLIYLLENNLITKNEDKL